LFGNWISLPVEKTSECGKANEQKDEKHGLFGQGQPGLARYIESAVPRQGSREKVEDYCGDEFEIRAGPPAEGSDWTHERLPANALGETGR
jgi:hypothetical protein